MISGIALGDVEAVIRYHSDTMNYAYSLDGKPIGLTPSELYGKGAQLAGVFGKAFQEQLLRDLLNGKVGGQVIAGGWNKDAGELIHVPAYDFTFAPGRSVSILALVVNDERVLVAHNAAVKATIDYMEQNGVRMRVYVDGDRQYVSSDNLVVGLARHITNRDGEPHLHTHGIIFNMTYDAAAGKWRALDLRKLEELRVKQELDRVYQTFLGDALEMLKYPVLRNEGVRHA